MSTGADLQAYVASWHGPFNWRTHNCCLFAAGWVAMFRPDPMESLRETDSMKDAWRLIDDMGGLADAVTRQLGIEPVNASLAHVGDVVLLNRTIGICNGRTAVCAAEDGSVVHLPMIDASLAWRIAP